METSVLELRSLDTRRPAVVVAVEPAISLAIACELSIEEVAEEAVVDHDEPEKCEEVRNVERHRGESGHERERVVRGVDERRDQETFDHDRTRVLAVVLGESEIVSRE